MQTSCRRCLSLAAGMFGKDYSAGAPLGLGRPNSTDCAPFSTTIERKPIPCTRQPSFSCPTRSRDIASVLAREMRSVSFVSKLIEEKNILGRTMKHMLIHSIEADDVMRAMNVRSKFNGRLGAGQHAYESRPRAGRRLACGSLRPARQTVDNRYPSEVSMNGLFAPRSSRTQSVEANFPPMQ